MSHWDLTPTFLAEIIVLILISYSSFDNRHIYKSKKERSFWLCMLLVFAIINIDLVSIYFIIHVDKVPLFLNHFVQILDFSLAGLVCFFVFRHIILLLHENVADEKHLRMSMVCLFSVTVIYLLMVLATPFTHWVYYFNADGQYVRGVLNKLPFLLYVASILFSSMGFFRFRKKVERYLYSMLIIGLLTATLLTTLQLFFPNITFSSMGATLVLLVIFISSQQNKNGKDSLTGIYTRTALSTSVDTFLNRKEPFYLLTIDLKNFKKVNSRYGQQGGDLLLKAIGLYLWSEIPYPIYRMVGASFGVLVPHQTEEEYEKILHKIMSRFEKPWEIANLSVVLDASFVDIFCEAKDSDSTNEIFSELEYTMDFVKSDSCVGYLRCDGDLHIAYEKQRYLLDFLRKALSEDRFRMCYQPFFSEKESAYIGAEALIRVNDVGGRPIPPSDFIPIAEKYGLIEEIGYVTLEKVCSFLGTKPYPAHWFVSVNISAKQFMNPAFISRLMEILKKNNVSPNRIKLELTEYVLYEDEAVAAANVQMLKNLGVGIFLDDFGTGYSNLFTVTHLPLECVKFDRTLIGGILGKNNSYQMLSSFIVGIQSVGIKTLIEGVEKEEQKKIVQEMGVDIMQGYYFSCPLEENELLERFSSVK